MTGNELEEDEDSDEAALEAASLKETSLAADEALELEDVPEGCSELSVSLVPSSSEVPSSLVSGIELSVSVSFDDDSVELPCPKLIVHDVIKKNERNRIKFLSISVFFISALSFKE